MKASPEFLEREYNARAAIPDHPQIFARLAQQGAAARRLHACLLDLPYGPSAAERLDFFPARHDGAPLLVFIHGGYWRSLDKGDYSWIAPPFVEQGAAVALINYGLAPAVAMEDIVRQALTALAWLYRRADDHGYDRHRIVVAGHSAGAHLGAMASAAIWPLLGGDLPARLVKGLLAVSGLYELEPLVRADFVNRDLQLTVERARRLSPAFLPAPEVPLITAVGGLESSEFRRQSALLGQAWKSQLAREITLTGQHHLDIVDELVNPASELQRAALHLLRSC